ncbi:MAG: RDD family protein [Candidatus Krumholzibacteriia bacterium]
MSQEAKASHAQMACYYPVKSYGSAWARALALTIDLTVATVLGALAFAASGMVAPDSDKTIILAGSLLSLLFCYVYFVELERSKPGTIGFRILGLRIVNLQGQQPSRLDMANRFVMAWLGPLNILVDLLWIPSDENRQALRDKFAGTYVIKRNAKPSGHGLVICATYFLLGFTWTFREVER